MTAEVSFLKRIRVHTGLWFPTPNQWCWARPDGHHQGISMLRAEDNRGLANLLWLAMDLERPPLTYDMRDNGLCVLLMGTGRRTTLDGLPLYQQAAELTLAQFRNACRDGAFVPPAGTDNYAPLLVMLANGRLNYAVTV